MEVKNNFPDYLVEAHGQGLLISLPPPPLRRQPASPLSQHAPVRFSPQATSTEYEVKFSWNTDIITLQQIDWYN